MRHHSRSVVSSTRCPKSFCRLRKVAIGHQNIWKFDLCKSFLIINFSFWYFVRLSKVVGGQVLIVPTVFLGFRCLLIQNISYDHDTFFKTSESWCNFWRPPNHLSFQGPNEVFVFSVGRVFWTKSEIRLRKNVLETKKKLFISENYSQSLTCFDKGTLWIEKIYRSLLKYRAWYSQ